jgi:hypothetical protein
MPNPLPPRPTSSPKKILEPQAQPESRGQTPESTSVSLVHHNPVTQQMQRVGKRREAAEALLAERLRDGRAAHC